MPSLAQAAYGTLLKRGATPGVYGGLATIGEVKSIKGPTTEVSVLDVTTHSSAASGNYREKVPSLIDPGEISFDINWVPSDVTIQNMRADLTNRTKRFWVIQTPADVNGASANVQMSGYITKFPLEFPTDDVMNASITITITGALTFAP